MMLGADHTEGPSGSGRAAQEIIIEQFVVLAKGLRGLALCDLINKATAEPGLFTLGELLCLPAVKELQAGEHGAALSLLQLFAYGTWSDYTSNPAAYPTLSDAQQHKLKLLTVASLTSGRRSIAYDELMGSLSVGSTRELEDILISDCIYGGLVQGRLDQKQRCLHVEDALARDVAPERLPEVAAALQEWLASTREVLKTIEERVAWTEGATKAAERRRTKLEAEVQAERRDVRAAMELQAQQDVGAMALDDADVFFNPTQASGEDEAARPSGSRVTKRRR